MRDLFRQTPPGPDELFDQARSLIEKNYIDKSGNPVTLDTSMRPDISSLVAQLDASSVYLDSEKALFLKHADVYGAVGISLRLKDRSCEIRDTFPRSPARRAGIRKGDRIPEIDGRNTAGLSTFSVLGMLRGPAGTDVKVRISRPSGEEKLFTLPREFLSLPKPRAIMIKETRTAYLRIERFDAEASGAMKKEAQRLQKEHAKGLIIDIRKNSGGLLVSVVEAAQIFLKRHDAVFTLGNMKGRKDATYESKGWNHVTGLPLVVVMGDKTSSGAELFAVALRDHNRALLLGEKTAGMVDIRSTYSLRDGSLITMRTAPAYRPSGALVDGNGVGPDRTVVLPEEARDAVYEKMDSAPDAYRGDDARDLQIKAAVDMLTDRSPSSTLTTQN